MSCLIIGDSIAVGVAQHRQECEVHARVGITSRAFNSMMGGELAAEVVVISLGSNDAGDPTNQLQHLRARIHSNRVIWIIPAYRNSDAVRAFARTYGDTTIEIPSLSPDHIHPTPKGYNDIARQTL